MDQVFQIAGALLILIPFAAAQAGRMTVSSVGYLTLNFVGSGILTGVALHGNDWGFLLLEVVWALVSAWGLVQVARGGRRAQA
jgi:hypothetical protein